MSDIPRQDPSPAPGSAVEPWLRGPVPGVPPLLQPVAHALLQAAEDVRRVVAPLDAVRVWQVAGRAAPIGFHVRHAGGSLDRLFTYARGEALSERQLAALRAEEVTDEVPEDGAGLVAAFEARIQAALSQVRATPESALTDTRTVGRRRLPSTVLGLLFHAAEHTQRHVGQIVTTARVLEP